jgi:hypothetical protein
MKHSFKGNILLAILLVQPSASMYAMDSPATRDTGKERVFIGNDTWVSGHPDKIATFSKDMEEMETKKNMSLIPGIDRDLSAVEVVVGGMFTGLLISHFFSLSTQQAAACGLVIGVLWRFIIMRHDQQCQQAVAQRVKDLGLEVYTEKDADKIR